MMYLDFWREEKARKKVAGSLAVLLILITVYVTALNFMIKDLVNSVEEAQAYEKEQVESFLDLRLSMQERDLLYIQKKWDVFCKTEYYNENDMTDSVCHFKEYHLRNFTHYIWLSIVSIYVQDESSNEHRMLYTDYGDSRYDEVWRSFINKSFEKKEGIQILNGEPELPFGSGERFYVDGIQLNDSVIAMVAFYEPIIFDGFIATSDTSMFDNITDQASAIMWSAVIFMLSIFVFGVFILYTIRSFVSETVREYTEKQPLGELAIKRGFMTRDQVTALIMEQERSLLEKEDEK